MEEQFENMNIDYRNSNYKLMIFKFDELKDIIYIFQDFRLGKGGIFWDGVFASFYLINSLGLF